MQGEGGRQGEQGWHRPIGFRLTSEAWPADARPRHILRSGGVGGVASRELQVADRTNTHHHARLPQETPTGLYVDAAIDHHFGESAGNRRQGHEGVSRGVDRDHSPKATVVGEAEGQFFRFDPPIPFCLSPLSLDALHTRLTTSGPKSRLGILSCRCGGYRQFTSDGPDPPPDASLILYSLYGVLLRVGFSYHRQPRGRHPSPS